MVEVGCCSNGDVWLMMSADTHYQKLFADLVISALRAKMDPQDEELDESWFSHAEVYDTTSGLCFCLFRDASYSCQLELVVWNSG